MNLGDSNSLRTLASALRRDAQDTDRVERRVSQGLAGLPDQADKYQRRTVEALHGRWSDVGSVLRGLSSDSEDLAGALEALAGVIDRSGHTWADVVGEAGRAGFAVHEDRWSPTVTAPASAEAPDVTHAQDLQTRLRGVVDDVARARDRLRGSLGSVAVHRVSVLQAGRTRAVQATTGESALDAEIDRVVGPLLAAHDALPRKA